MTAIIGYVVMDKSINHDSDSELEEALHLSRKVAGTGLSDDKPPRPGNSAMPPSTPASTASFSALKQIDSGSDSEDDEDDPNDPFGDKNAATAPCEERKGYSWKEV